MTRAKTIKIRIKMEAKGARNETRAEAWGTLENKKITGALRG